jgi:hypothetical protein
MSPSNASLAQVPARPQLIGSVPRVCTVVPDGSVWRWCLRGIGSSHVSREPFTTQGEAVSAAKTVAACESTIYVAPSVPNLLGLTWTAFVEALADGHLEVSHE